jgi:hypothetical protein
MSLNTSISPMARAAVVVTLTLSSFASSTLFSSAWAADDGTVQALRDQIDAMRVEYEARLRALEAKLEQVQASAAATASASANAPSGSPALTAAPSEQARDNRFNPAISLILNGTYANLSKDPETWHISGFAPGGEELGPGSRGFSLGESELNLSANIDSWLYGSMTLAVTPEEHIETEEAFVQTTALPSGLTLKAGRFFGALGYLNEQHAHVWDFADAPLTHQAFLGGQYRQEGLQVKWLLPMDRFVELGAELGKGASFPGNDRQRNGMGSVALMAHTGDDVGESHNWRAGVSWLSTKAKDRTWETTDAFDQDVTNAFTGRSRLWVIDGVWKWAPQGNAKRTNFKLQGEYFRRTETGALIYDVDTTARLDAYRSAQSGWYLQGIYQFAPRWRAGLRHDQLDGGHTELASNAANLIATDHAPTRESVMLDWNPSEFQRWRVQLSHDRAREGVKDTQFFLQYQVNLGAHGAHGY